VYPDRKSLRNPARHHTRKRLAANLRETEIMRVILIILFFGFFSKNCPSQNLILNGNFEDINICSEHLAPCSPEAWRQTSTLIAENFENDGNHYSGFVVFNSSVRNLRGYLQSRLSDKLHVGKRYRLSINILAGDILINSIGVLFSDSIILSRTNNILNLKPKIDFTNNKNYIGYKNDKKWQKFDYEFTSDSEAKFIIIGCFLTDSELKYHYQKGKFKEFNDYYYYIDNISLIPIDTQHDTSVIHNNKIRIYSHDFRHPVPDTLFNWAEKEKTDLKKNQTTAIFSDTIFLYNDLLFEFNSFEPSSYFFQKIDSVFNIITFYIDSIIIIGHTDSIGTESYNNELSFKRADSISKYILSKGIISNNRIVVYGKGSKFPIDTNSTENGRYNNRRVEIIIKYKSAANTGYSQWRA